MAVDPPRPDRLDAAARRRMDRCAEVNGVADTPDASSLLVPDALVQIPTTAHLRSDLLVGKDEASGGGLINEYKRAA